MRFAAINGVTPRSSAQSKKRRISARSSAPVSSGACITFSEADFRREIEMFGRRSTLGSFIVNNVLAACAAYRTQIFLYLKSCGRVELSTMNLWAGMDAPAPAQS